MCLLSPNLHNQPAEYCPILQMRKQAWRSVLLQVTQLTSRLDSHLACQWSVQSITLLTLGNQERNRNIIKSLPPKSCPLAVFHPANNLPATPTLEHFRRFPELSAFVHEVARSSLPPRSRNRAFAPKYTLSSLFHYKTPHSQWFLSVPLLMLIPGIIPGFWDLPTWT